MTKRIATVWRQLYKLRCLFLSGEIAVAIANRPTKSGAPMAQLRTR